MSSTPIRLLRSFVTVGGWTMASRILGFLRDILMAAFLGSGPVAQAFVVAFTLPNMFRRFFGEGALNTAFVPLFAKRLEGEGAEDARQFAEQTFSVLASFLLILTLVAMAVMPWLVLALASGFEGGARFELSVMLGRITFVYIVFISLAAMLSGVLNSLGRFAAAAAAPVLLNVILIAVLLVAESGMLKGTVEPGAILADDRLHHGVMLSWGVVLAGIAQLALVWMAARKAGMPVRPRWPRLTPDLKRLAIIAFPAALAAGVMQINIVVGRQVASYFDGAVVWLWFADRVYQLPLGVVGVAVGVVLLPELARRVRADDPSGASSAMNRAAEFALVLTLPATMALLVIPALIVTVLFERGAFTADDASATALALAIYAAGLPAFVLQKIVQPAYFAREDTRTPLRFALWSMVVNVVIAVGLAPAIGYLAAALGTTLAGWANLVLLWRGVRGLDAEIAMDARLKSRLPRIVLASCAMAALVLGVVWVLQGLTVPDLWVLILAVGTGAISFAALGWLLGAFQPREILSATRRGAS